MHMKSHKKLRRLTNVDDLSSDGVEDQSDLKPSVLPFSVTASVEQRSTIDPFAVELADATIAEKIEKASPRVRGRAWVLLACPPFIAWLNLVCCMSRTRPWIGWCAELDLFQHCTGRIFYFADAGDR
jgi:hypothetical protein